MSSALIGQLVSYEEFEAAIRAASLGWLRATWIGGTIAALRRCSAMKNMDAS
jgi:hypothetical protein